MTLRTLSFIALFVAGCPLAFAARTALVETRGAYLKITDADKISGPSPETETPGILYIRKSPVLSASVTFFTKTSDYRVTIVTNCLSAITGASGDKILLTASAKAYTYSFSKQNTAEAFCEAVVNGKSN